MRVAASCICRNLTAHCGIRTLCVQGPFLFAGKITSPDFPADGNKKCMEGAGYEEMEEMAEHHDDGSNGTGRTKLGGDWGKCG